MQAFLAAENLATILSSWGILNTDSVQELEQNCDFQSIYRNSWADHANLISVQYAGTGALKTDYTRTGVRTHWGLLQVSHFRCKQSFTIFFLAYCYTCHKIHCSFLCRMVGILQFDTSKITSKTDNERMVSSSFLANYDLATSYLFKLWTRTKSRVWSPICHTSWWLF